MTDCCPTCHGPVTVERTRRASDGIEGHEEWTATTYHSAPPSEALRDAALDLYGALFDALPPAGDGSETPFDELIAAIAGPMSAVRAALASGDTPGGAASVLHPQPVGLMGPHRVLVCPDCGSQLMARFGSLTHNDDGTHTYDPAASGDTETGGTA